MSMARERVRYLDGLRGVAALAVVFQHVAEIIISNDPALAPFLLPAFLYYFNAGRFGIALFFLISGFVIPFSFKKPHPIRNFAISRFFRLYPAYWLSLALALVIFPLLTNEIYSTPRILANVTMVQAAFGQHDVIGAYWTLFIELAFYVLCAGLFFTRLLANWRALVGAILAGLSLSLAMAVMASVRGSHLPANIPLNLALMFLGTLMRRGWLERDLSASNWIAPISAVWAGIMPLILWLTPKQPDIPLTPLSFCLAYWLALIVFIVAAKLNLPKGRIFGGLGAVSYSLYLFHGICLEIMLYFVPPNSFWQDIVFAVVLVAISISLSVIVYNFVERPTIRLGHRVMVLGQAISENNKANFIHLRRDLSE